MTVRVRRSSKGWIEYDITGHFPDGTAYRERRKSHLQTIAHTERWAHQREKAILEEQSTTPPTAAPTFAEFFPRYMTGHVLANRQKPSVVTTKNIIARVHLLPLFGGTRLDKISATQVQELKAALGARSPKTVNNVLSLLNTTLRVAVEWGVLKSMPVKITLFKSTSPQMEFYDFEVYERLVDAASKVSWRSHALVLLAGDAGMRRGEIVSLRLTDCDFDRGFITVQRSEYGKDTTSPKGGRSRRIPMTERLKKVLKANRHLQGERLLYQDGTRRFTPRAVREAVSAAERRANLPATGRLHVLRHTFCSHLAMRGATVLDIKELAGHTSITTTQRYMHLSPASADRAIRLLDEGRTADQIRGEIMETKARSSK